MEVFINAAQCNWCDDVIVSFNQHDCVKCRCYSEECGIMIDGGSGVDISYRRVVWSNEKDFRDLSFHLDLRLT